MSFMKMIDVAARLRDVVEPYVSSVDRKDIAEFMYVGEPGLAMQWMLSIAAENELQMNGVLLKDLLNISSDLGELSLKHLKSLQTI